MHKTQTTHLEFWRKRSSQGWKMAGVVTKMSHFTRFHDSSWLLIHSSSEFLLYHAIWNVELDLRLVLLLWCFGDSYFFSTQQQDLYHRLCLISMSFSCFSWGFITGDTLCAELGCPWGQQDTICLLALVTRVDADNRGKEREGWRKIIEGWCRL